ncbi:hypothetical protein AMK29_13485 [Streptomyces sp. CB02261]|nr:hypothetical protein AMK29_13485 [Streptomyces sp. CB02261]
MFVTERPRRKRSRSRISCRSPYRTPPPSEATSPSARRIAKSAHVGRPGSARTAVPRAKKTAVPVSAARGGSRSAAESRVVAPSSWASEGPKSARAESRGEPVARYTSVASPSPATVWAAVWAAPVRKSGVNSGVRKTSW